MTQAADSLFLRSLRRPSEIVNLIDLNVEREGDIVPHEFEVRMLHHMRNVCLAAGEEIIGAQYVVPGGKQAFAKMRPEESGPTGY